MGIRQAMWFFFPYRKPIARFPRRIALDKEEVRTATRDELTLIEFGVARTPKEARRMMQEAGAAHALDIIEAIPKRRGWFRRRWQTLMMRIEGTNHTNPHRRMSDNHGRYEVFYE